MFRRCEAYCRFLNATNEFAESLVVMRTDAELRSVERAGALSTSASSQMQLGRFEDALADVHAGRPASIHLPVARWTWMIGAGWTYVADGP